MSVPEPIVRYEGYREHYTSPRGRFEPPTGCQFTLKLLTGTGREVYDAVRKWVGNPPAARGISKKAVFFKWNRTKHDGATHGRKPVIDVTAVMAFRDYLQERYGYEGWVDLSDGRYVKLVVPHPAE